MGWVYQYALIDRTRQRDLSQLRALNDWFLKFELKTVPVLHEVNWLNREEVVRLTA